MMLNSELEGVFFQLPEGQEVLVTDLNSSAPVTLKISSENGDDPILSIWLGDGEVKVEKDRVDLLDLNGPVRDSLRSQA